MKKFKNTESAQLCPRHQCNGLIWKSQLIIENPSQGVPRIVDTIAYVAGHDLPEFRGLQMKDRKRQAANIISRAVAMGKKDRGGDILAKSVDWMYVSPLAGLGRLMEEVTSGWVAAEVLGGYMKAPKVEDW